VKDWGVKQLFLKGGRRLLNKACNQGLKLEAAKWVAKPPRLQDVKAGTPMATYML
jgi:hypothetical protein